MTRHFNVRTRPRPVPHTTRGHQGQWWMFATDSLHVIKIFVNCSGDIAKSATWLAVCLLAADVKEFVKVCTANRSACQSKIRRYTIPPLVASEYKKFRHIASNTVCTHWLYPACLIFLANFSYLLLAYKHNLPLYMNTYVVASAPTFMPFSNHSQLRWQHYFHAMHVIYPFIPPSLPNPSTHPTIHCA